MCLFEVILCASAKSFLDEMDILLKAKAYSLIEILEQRGNQLREPHSKALKDGLFELRIKSKDKIARLFYCFALGKRIYILHGFIKKSNKTPKNELAKALKIMQEILDE